MHHHEAAVSVLLSLYHLLISKKLFICRRLLTHPPVSLDCHNLAKLSLSPIYINTLPFHFLSPSFQSKRLCSTGETVINTPDQQPIQQNTRLFAVIPQFCWGSVGANNSLSVSEGVCGSANSHSNLTVRERLHQTLVSGWNGIGLQISLAVSLSELIIPTSSSSCLLTFPVVR